MNNSDILRISEIRWPVHCAIYELDDKGEEWIIHSYLPYRKVVREPVNYVKRSQISSVWRFPEWQPY